MVAPGEDEPLARPPLLRASEPEPVTAVRSNVAPAQAAAARRDEPGGAGGPPGATTLIELEVAGRVIARARIVKR